MKRSTLVLAIVLSWLCLPAAAVAEVAGTVVAVEGSVQIGRASSWAAAELGGPVHVGDQLKTEHLAHLCSWINF